MHWNLFLMAHAHRVRWVRYQKFTGNLQQSFVKFMESNFNDTVRLENAPSSHSVNLFETSKQVAYFKQRQLDTCGVFSSSKEYIILFKANEVTLNAIVFYSLDYCFYNTFQALRTTK